MRPSALVQINRPPPPHASPPHYLHDISQLVPGVLGGRRCGRLYRYWWRALSFTLAFHLYPNALVFIGRHGRIRPPKDVGNNATLRPILRRRHCYAWIEAPTRRLMPRLRLRCVQKPLSIASRLQEEANQRVRPRPATVCRRSPRRRCTVNIDATRSRCVLASAPVTMAQSSRSSTLSK